MNMRPVTIYPSLFLISLTLALLVIAPLEAVLNSSRVLAVASVLLILLVVGVRSGRPSSGLIRRDINNHYGSVVYDVAESKAHVIAGDYWLVWPAVLATNMMLYKMHAPREVYGLCYRSRETSFLWEGQQQLCFAAQIHDPSSRLILAYYGHPLRLTEVRNTIQVLCEP